MPLNSENDGDGEGDSRCPLLLWRSRWRTCLSLPPNLVNPLGRGGLTLVSWDFIHWVVSRCAGLIRGGPTDGCGEHWLKYASVVNSARETV
eukprot:scaffold1982_cov93-Amphora_coffeaeformis.AAC.53